MNKIVSLDLVPSSIINCCQRHQVNSKDWLKTVNLSGNAMRKLERLKFRRYYINIVLLIATHVHRIIFDKLRTTEQKKNRRS
jgi:hypothetical protein